MGKLERKFGKYAIKNLSLILLICYGVGYLLSLTQGTSTVLAYLSLDPYAIIHGQVWRLVTWVLIPPSEFTFLTVISLIFYYSIGRTLERTWGDFLYNVYIFSGMLFTIVGMFALMGILMLFPNDYVTYYGMAGLMSIVGRLYVSTYYINMSIFLAFAMTFPDIQVLLMFIIPIRMKWLGYAYGVLLVYECIVGNLFSRVIIFMSLLNFIVFFIIYRRNRYGSIRFRAGQAVRRAKFTGSVRAASTPNGISKHKCAICGCTELTNPDMQFRFCSKCNGNYEYCSEHIFTHKHIGWESEL